MYSIRHSGARIICCGRSAWAPDGREFDRRPGTIAPLTTARPGPTSEDTGNYAASCFKLVDSSRAGKDANIRTVATHIDRCSSNSYLARSISTFFLAANSVQTRKHADKRASMYSLRPASNARSRFQQIGQSILCASPAFCPANRRSSTGSSNAIKSREQQ